MGSAMSEYCINGFLKRKKHYTYLEHLNNIKKGEEVDKDYFSFAFVRNPFDRLVSQFHFTGRQWWNKYEEIAKYKFSFKNYVKYVVAAGRPFSNHKKTKGRDQDWSMLQFVDGGVDFIGKFENLQEDFDVVCDKIGIPRKELPHKNKTKHKHYSGYYDDETKRIVAKKYTKDIKYFDYKFEN